MVNRNRTESQLERFDPNRQAVNDAVAHANWAEKKWTWISDKDEGYLAAHIVEEGDDNVKVRLANNESIEKTVHVDDCQKMNPPKFDKAEDMADLTYLNEASVIHNLRLRYFSNLIYTYSGLFLVAVNPYTKLPLYTDEIVKAYRNKKRSEMAPHIYAISDHAYYTMLQDRENQSILITGESGAGKTENTKKVIQYITSIAKHSQENAGDVSATSTRQGPLEQQIIQTNPILEAFGNAQTIRNNNSSRFGKFIRIEFTAGGNIAGANLERYLLEKSRVTHQSPKERNYHIFYQLLKSPHQELKRKVLLDGLTANDFAYVQKSNQNVDGVDDVAEFLQVQEAFEVVGFSELEILEYYRIVAAVLFLGNIKSVADEKDEQAQINDTSVAEKVCHLLGLPVKEFVQGLVKPTVKAGREWVVASRTVEQVSFSVDALAKAIYERMFGRLIDRLNEALDTPRSRSNFIGVLDIAGFEIFESNSFEQLCINYTNERLQQFFNHHMFILEQEEYKREGIEWKFIDFGMDLQPTIDLIEKTTPIGILSLLDEECVMPKATDKTFTEKLHSLWKGKTNKYEQPRFNQGFILHHYAGRVEYSTSGWLDKNKDPLNETVTRLLAQSSSKYVAGLFEDALGEEVITNSKKASILKKGAFRTVAQRHKEQLVSLMNQLYSTTPHFVRCILPNDEKKPRLLKANLVLEQLRCNGVLEGIRICRQGFPNRVPFAEFRQRYEILAPGVIPKGFFDGRQAAQLILETLTLDKNTYRLGSSKVFFRAGVLAELEELRDERLSILITRIQALVRGFLARRSYARLTKYQTAIKTIQKNARVYVTLRSWAWWRLYSKVKPLLNVSRIDEEMRQKDALIQSLQQAKLREEEERRRLELLQTQLETEKRNVEALLISEKNAAAGQQEILLRTQESRGQLEEALSRAQADLERLQEQFDEAVRNRKALETKIEQVESKLSDTTQSLERLERERLVREQQAAQVEQDWKSQSERSRVLESEKRALEQQIADLKVSLESATNRCDEMTRQKGKLSSNMTDLEEQLQELEAEKRKTEEQRDRVEKEKVQLYENLIEVQREKGELESTLERKQKELSGSLEQERSDRERVDKERRELALRLAEIEQSFQLEKEEKGRLLNSKNKLERDLEHLHTVMQEKGNEESKQSELRRLRESELNDIRSQLATVQSQLEEARQQHAKHQEQSRANVEDALAQVESWKTKKADADRLHEDAQEKIDQLTESVSRLERNKKQLEQDLQSMKENSNKSEVDFASARETLEKQIAHLNSRIEDRESEVSRLDREKNALGKQLEQTRAELEEEGRRRNVAEQARKKAVQEFEIQSGKLEDTEQTAAELEKKLAQRSTELETLRSQITGEIASRMTENEERLRKADKELHDWQVKCDDLDRNCGNLEKTKARLTAEIEDLHHEIEREHQVARNAERSAKQFEQQLSSLNSQVEAERRQREQAESSVRKLNIQLDSLNGQLAEKEASLSSLTKAKSEMESELKSLVDEIGQGGKSIHELEKAKRRLDAQVAELGQQLEEEQQTRVSLEEAKNRMEVEFSELRRKLENDLSNKESQMEETRRMLLKEVNSLGEQLDEQISVKNELLKHKKRLEDALEEASSRAENSSKSQTEADKLKRRLEQITKELTGKLEAEEQARKNFEELATRHEKKSNSLQSTLEQLEQQLESIERSKRSLESRVSELEVLVDQADASKVAALDQKKKLERDLVEIQERMQDEMSAVREDLERQRASADQRENDSRVREEYQVQLERLEEQKRALQTAQRILQQEVEEKSRELANVEKQRRLLQSEVEDVRMRLESELVAKSDEQSARRKLQTEIKEWQLKFEAESAKTNELGQFLETSRQKTEAAQARLEAAELGKIKAEKSEAVIKMQLKELSDSLNDLVKEKRVLEERERLFEKQLQDLNDKSEEDQQELAELQLSKRRVDEEYNRLQERYKRETDEQEANLDATRRKYAKELSQVMSELETEKSNLVRLKTLYKDLEDENDEIGGKLEEAIRNASSLLKEKDRLEQRLVDYARLLEEANRSGQDHGSRLDSLMSQIRELRLQLDESEAKSTNAERQMRQISSRLDDALDAKIGEEKLRAELAKRVSSLESENTRLKHDNDEAQEIVEDVLAKLRKAELTAQDAVSEVAKERETAQELERSKISLEAQLKELNARILDLEAMALSDSSRGNTSRLQARLEEQTLALDREIRERTDLLKEKRQLERTIKDLQYQLAERDKTRIRAEEDTSRMEVRMKEMRSRIEQLENAESNLELAKRRAEREANELRERAHRYEKEFDRSKASRTSLSNLNL